MTRRLFCSNPKCRILLGIADNETLHFKLKSDETVVAGKDFVVTKICRRCGTRHEIPRPAQP